APGLGVRLGRGALSGYGFRFPAAELGRLLTAVVVGDNHDQPRTGRVDSRKPRLDPKVEPVAEHPRRRLLRGARPEVHGAGRDDPARVVARLLDLPTSAAEVLSGPRGQPLDRAVVVHTYRNDRRWWRGWWRGGSSRARRHRRGTSRPGGLRRRRDR